MALEFLCPKGHKIRCPEDRAGQAARCPKCGVKFIIPEAAAASSSEPPGTGSGPGGSTIKSGSGSSKGQIQFLCPNGHLLHGPSRLQGHPGQCPECGSKFRIPTYDQAGNEEAEPAPKAAESHAAVEPMADSAVNLSEGLGHYENLRADAAQAGGKVRTALVSDSSGRLQRAREIHPLYEVFSRLWAIKGASGQIEVRLSNGDKLAPHSFAATMSRGSHAVLGLKEADGSFTVAAVPWDSIAEVLVRRLGELPEEMRG